MVSIRVVWAMIVAAGCGPTMGDGVGGSRDGTRGDDSGVPKTDGVSATGAGSTGFSGSTTAPLSTVGGSTAPVDEAGLDTSASDGRIVGVCEDRLGCAMPVDCDTFDCGTLGSRFDDAGCLWPPCSFKLNCPDGGVCFFPEEWGMCTPTGVMCREDDRVCECAMTDDCGGRMCMPAGVAPPTQCNLIDDENACIDRGCTASLDVRPIVDAGDGSCLCELAVPQCVWISPDATTERGDATPYYNLLSAQVVVFEDRIDPPPAGWIACDDLGASTPECDCAALLPCAM